MDLTDLDLRGYGRFLGDRKAGFAIETPNLPALWEYIYQNGKMFLRVDQHGLAFAQAFPPGDLVMLMRDRFEKSSVWMTWFQSERFKTGPFTNFFRPTPGIADPRAVPARFRVEFTPGRAVYRVEHQGLRVVTEVSLAADQPAIVQAVTVENLTSDTLPLTAIPALRPACRWATMAPWDKPEWYLRTAFCLDPNRAAGFSIHVTHSGCDASRRRAAAFWTGLDGLTGGEVSYDAFVGAGTFDNPEAVAKGRRPAVGRIRRPQPDVFVSARLRPAVRVRPRAGRTADDSAGVRVDPADGGRPAAGPGNRASAGRAA